MDLKSNIALLLLQIILYRQQELCHNNKSIKYTDLLINPVLDDSILKSFSTHKLVKLYAPELHDLDLPRLTAIFHELFFQGIPDIKEPITIITLANYYYDKRIQELERDEIPKLKHQLTDRIFQGEIV